jgi:hypothetical protein
MGRKWNKDNHKPVIDPNGAGGPSTKDRQKSGDGRAIVKSTSTPAPKRKP